MIRCFHAGTVIALLAACGLTVGCCDKEKKQIEYLTQQNLNLTNKDKEMRDELVGARTRESQLLAQIDSKDQVVTTLQAQKQDLEQRLAAGTTAQPPAGGVGGETTVYKETVASDVLFAPGQATLSASGKQRLASTASLLKSKYAGMSVRVYGYTDSDPIRHSRKLWTDNLDLSANRAMAVTRYLRSRGISAESIETVAMGATHFVTGNNTKAGKAKNRRVEIAVVKK